MRTRKQGDKDLGPNSLDQMDAAKVSQALVRRLEKLGHKVSLQPAAA